MDVRTKIPSLLFVFVFVCSPLLSQQQQAMPKCKTACVVRHTCAMVKRGNAEPQPECVPMHLAILLNNAIQGGPSGPGTGLITEPSSSSTHTAGTVHSHDTASGIITHEHTVPTQTSSRGVQAVRDPGSSSGLGLGSSPFDVPRDTGPRGFHSIRDPPGPSGGVDFGSGPFDVPRDPIGPFRPGPIGRDFPLFDPITGRPVIRDGLGWMRPPGPFVPLSALLSEGMTTRPFIRPRFDRRLHPDAIPGVSFARSRPNSFGGGTIEHRRGHSGHERGHTDHGHGHSDHRRTGMPHDRGHVGHNRDIPEITRQPARRPPTRGPPTATNRFSGTADVMRNGHSHDRRGSHSHGVNTLARRFPRRITAPPIGTPSMSRISSRPRPETRDQVSLIQEDESGLHYMFFPLSASQTGIRVNITKSGFCRQTPQTREITFCLNTCFSDSHCPRDLKCCPGGCSVNCLEPSI